MITVLCFGNEFLPEDSLAKKLAEEIKLKGVRFVKSDNVDELLDYEGKLVILDVVKDLKKVSYFGIEDIEVDKIFTSHDLGLDFFLKIMKLIGKTKDITIIGIPQKGDEEQCKYEVIKLLKRLV